MTATYKGLPNWMANVQRRESASMRIFCFPYAGGSSVIYHDWLSLLPSTIEVFPIQLPGRGMRLASPPFARLGGLIEELLPAIQPYLDRPFFFFGHSMGALIAFELARCLRANFHIEPQTLFVSGRSAPGFADSHAGLYKLPRQEFIARLRLMNGTHPDLLKHEELLDMILPALRADFELVQTYSFQEGTMLSCPVQAFGGVEDNHITKASLQAWEAFTSGPFSLEMLPGDHFFIHSQRSRLLAGISREIKRCGAGARPALAGL